MAIVLRSCRRPEIGLDHVGVRAHLVGRILQLAAVVAHVEVGQVQAEHQAILDAIARRDPQAAAEAKAAVTSDKPKTSETK